ncbi:MAG: hypothetical protein JWO81_1875, partial [Alphaproteobacteria bacterium]|nr:hypothetical protein [Alphaproteobacteria bacterium]
MTAIKAFSNGRRLCAALMVGTIIGGLADPAFAQGPPPVRTAPPAPAAAAAQAPATGAP